jgi:guanosine-3',5'-bis(diphosphate) 3'-pyrophosphohydrolase
MLLAMARDVRVILIKLADRTAQHAHAACDAAPGKRQRIARETLDIYAPIAHRLGLNQTYRELQELSFEHLRPWRHQALSKAVTRRARHAGATSSIRVQREVEKAFAAQKHQGARSPAAKRRMLLHLPQDAREARRLCAGDRHLRLSHRRAHAARVLPALGVLHQLYKPVPGRFKDYIAIPKANGYQSLHTTLVSPLGTAVEFQIRTEAMHAVAESGVAAHWLYKASDKGQEQRHRRCAAPGRHLAAVADRHPGRNARRGRVPGARQDRPVPRRGVRVHAQEPDPGLPRGATAGGLRLRHPLRRGRPHRGRAKVNGEPVALRTELKSGDVVEVITAPGATPNPAWLGLVRTGRARSKIRHHLKTMEQAESQELGEKMLAQALRAEGIENLPEDNAQSHATWEKLLRFTGNRSRAELLTDLGLGKRIASIVAKRLMTLMTEGGEKPNALLMTRERYTAHESVSQGSVMLDGSENASVQYAPCCRPIPGDNIVGYLGRGEGLVVHVAECAVAKRLQHKDSERFIAVEWSDDPVRTFETSLIVTVTNDKGVLARVAAALASAEADITHLDMGNEAAQDAMDMRFLVAVRDQSHLDAVLRNVRRTASVLRARRVLPANNPGN